RSAVPVFASVTSTVAPLSHWLRTVYVTVQAGAGSTGAAAAGGVVAVADGPGVATAAVRCRMTNAAPTAPTRNSATKTRPVTRTRLGAGPGSAGASSGARIRVCPRAAAPRSR